MENGTGAGIAHLHIFVRTEPFVTASSGVPNEPTGMCDAREAKKFLESVE
jgi:hypothetical protein